VLSKEVSDVSAISNALCLQIIRNKAIPDENNWDTVAGSWMARPIAQISTNTRRFQRAF
jgi:hypothetical protein